MAQERDGKDLDVITIGRASVDLYGQQIGGRLEDMASFAKSVGGCPTNIAVGTARLGLKSALLTRVGDEHMGRFIREQLAREGVETAGIRTDPARLTALVLLGIRDEDNFPLIFYRENCADMALAPEDVDEALISRARAIVVTGTHFSRENTEAAQLRAMQLARRHGGKIVFDIDYRPNLWGLAGHNAGDSRYAPSTAVTERLQRILPDCDLVIGTLEEIRIAAGCEEPLEALRRLRALTQAVIVLKRGPMGCVVYPDAIPANLDDGIVGAGFPIEVFNVLGAGDAFMSGFLRGWLRGEKLATCATWANACGAMVVSRLLCAPEIPTWPELQYFLDHGSPQRALRLDAEINHRHWATTRRGDWPNLMAFAIDHRAQFEAIADRLGAPRDRIAAFKVLAVAAAAKVANGRPGFGMLIDGSYGREALFRAADHDFWLARPVERPGSRPLRFETHDLGSHLADWPVTHTIKCLCFYHPDDPEALRAEQEERLLTLHDAARKAGRELLIEIIAGKNGALGEETVAGILSRLYDLGIRPDWWKLEPHKMASAWQRIGDVIRSRDPLCRGVVLLGLEASEDDLRESFELAASDPIVKGFAVGRTIFADAAEAWLAGRIGDDAAIADMAERFAQLTEAWRQALARHRRAA
ncbi:5-dehydro-2-deoxygluconokinase [Dongia sp.]|uniref:bifunctional 5-dehydro-2-deoxygluconokinase/5-dehydro-2- deoxyphosphogluconate aldolase n=1 Tax=Dongia sp. TaxID=1977262 RepID=UPI0035B28FFA